MNTSERVVPQPTQRSVVITRHRRQGLLYRPAPARLRTARSHSRVRNPRSSSAAIVVQRREDPRLLVGSGKQAQQRADRRRQSSQRGRERRDGCRDGVDTAGEGIERTSARRQSCRYRCRMIHIWCAEAGLSTSGVHRRFRGLGHSILRTLLALHASSVARGRGGSGLAVRESCVMHAY